MADNLRELVVFGVSGCDTRLLTDALAEHEALTQVEAAQLIPGFDASVVPGERHGARAGRGPEQPAPRNGDGCIADAGAAVPWLIEAARVLPDATFIVLLRDVRDVVLEGIEGSGPEPADPGKLATRWLGEVQAVLEFERENPARVVKVAFEDLVLAPRTEILKICLACELPATEIDLASVVERSAAGRADTEPRWLSELSPPIVMRVENIVQPTLSLIGYAPIDQWHELGVMRLKANRYDQLRRELELLQLEASSHDALRKELVALRAQVRELDAAAVASASVPAATPEDEAMPADNAWRDALEAELAALRLKTDRYDSLLDEVQSLRYKAKQYDEISESLPTLRYRSQKHDELLQENLVLRGKARRYDELRKKLALLFAVRRTVRRVAWTVRRR